MKFHNYNVSFREHCLMITCSSNIIHVYLLVTYFEEILEFWQHNHYTSFAPMVFSVKQLYNQLCLYCHWRYSVDNPSHLLSSFVPSCSGGEPKQLMLLCSLTNLTWISLKTYFSFIFYKLKSTMCIRKKNPKKY